MSDIDTRGEVRTGGWVNGRQITTDDLLNREPLPLPVRRVENSMPCGLRMGWLDAEDTDPDSPVDSVTLTAGAGCGSPWMVLTIKMTDGSRIEEAVDMRDVVASWVAAAVAAGPTPEVAADE